MAENEIVIESTDIVIQPVRAIWGSNSGIVVKHVPANQNVVVLALMPVGSWAFFLSF